MVNSINNANNSPLASNPGIQLRTWPKSWDQLKNMAGLDPHIYTINA